MRGAPGESALASCAAIGLALALVASPAAAQTVAPSSMDAADLQCFGVFIYLGGQGSDPAAKAWFTGEALHYLGRLEGRSPTVNWLDRLTAYFAGPFPGEFEAQRERCGAEATARDTALEGWSTAFMARVEAARKAD